MLPSKTIPEVKNQKRHGLNEARDHETNNHCCPSEEEGKSNIWYQGRG